MMSWVSLGRVGFCRRWLVWIWYGSTGVLGVFWDGRSLSPSLFLNSFSRLDSLFDSEIPYSRTLIARALEMTRLDDDLLCLLCLGVRSL